MSTATDNAQAITLDCGHAPTTQPAGSCGTGYARDAATDATMCYPCADSRTAEQVASSKPGDAITLYVSTDGTRVTTWSGGVIMNRVMWGKRHAWSSRHEPRHYMRAIDVDGRVWSGVGGEGMWCTLKLTGAPRVNRSKMLSTGEPW
jgi:hypothetical protein